MKLLTWNWPAMFPPSETPPSSRLPRCPCAPFISTHFLSIPLFVPPFPFFLSPSFLGFFLFIFYYRLLSIFLNGLGDFGKLLLSKLEHDSRLQIVLQWELGGLVSSAPCLNIYLHLWVIGHILKFETNICVLGLNISNYFFCFTPRLRQRNFNDSPFFLVTISQFWLLLSNCKSRNVFSFVFLMKL